MFKKLFSFLIVAALLFTTYGTVAFASHNAPVVAYETAPDSCGETTFTAHIDETLGHKVANMYLVVSYDGMTYSELIPIDGSDAEIVVPGMTTLSGVNTVYYRVFGGGERDYDMPLWNGYGDASFGSDISDYLLANGDSWLLAGTEDTNPFVNWEMVEIETCQLTVPMCKNGGWEEYGFRNQGQCIRYVNTGKDSRES